MLCVHARARSGKFAAGTQGLAARVGGWALATVLLVVLGGCNSFLRRQALNAMDQGDLNTADVKLRQAVTRDPGDYRALFYLAQVRMQQGKALEAQQHLEQALVLEPDGPDTPAMLDLMAESLYQQGDYSRLTTFLNDTASRRHNLSDYRRSTQYFARIGDTDGVNLSFLKAAKFAAPDDPRPYLAAGKYYRSVGDQDREITNLRHAYYIMPDNKAVQDRLRELGVVPGPTVGLPPLSEVKPLDIK